MSRNPPWRREELILALDLYMTHRGSLPGKGSPEIAELSHSLNQLAAFLGLVAGDERFRNEAGVYMKLMNFLPYDPDYGGVGLQAGGRLDKEVWNEFSGDRDKRRRAARSIRRRIREPGSSSRPASLEAIERLAENDVRRRQLRKPAIRLGGLKSIVSLIERVLPQAAHDPSLLNSWPKKRLVPRLEAAKGRKLNGAESSALTILLSYLPSEPGARWRDAVLAALRRFARRHGSRKVGRGELLEEERQRIVKETGTGNLTRDQTVNRVLEDLRDDGLLYFMGRGTYLLLDAPVDVEAEDLPDRALDFAAARNKIRLGTVTTSDETVLARRRKGQDRVRVQTLQNYGGACAFCDVTDERLLVASHVSRWADDRTGRGDLTNVICMCKFHDALFEVGYISLTDDLKVLRRNDHESRTIAANLDAAISFRHPTDFAPARRFLRKHRRRTGFDKDRSRRG